MMPSVRTTLTLDPDVERLLDDEVHRTRLPFKQVVNAALRRGLMPGLAGAPEEPYRAKVHKAKARAGIDPYAMNRLVDELEDEAVDRKAVPPSPIKGRRRGPRSR